MKRFFAIPPYWPTLLVAAAIYLSYGLLTWFYHELPGWFIFIAGGYVIAWHGSLQHEVVHGNPTASRWLNEALIFPSLWLWLPFRSYQRSHLLHHRNQYLTDPKQDPESFYVTAQTWKTLAAPIRGYLWIYNTALGRLLLSPFAFTIGFWNTEIKRLWRDLWSDDKHSISALLWHIPACALVLIWVSGICQIPLIEYLLLFIYPSLSLTSLRSFLEHQATPESAHRSVIVDAGPIMSMLYLCNNLHALHHAKPATPWYQVKNLWQQNRAEILALNNAYYYRGYSEVIRRHGLKPKEPPYHSLSPSLQPSPQGRG